MFTEPARLSRLEEGRSGASSPLEASLPLVHEGDDKDSEVEVCPARPRASLQLAGEQGARLLVVSVISPASHPGDMVEQKRILEEAQALAAEQGTEAETIGSNG